MKIMAQSRYIRFDNQNDIIRQWIAIILLKADLDSQLLFGSIDSSIIRGFNISVLTKDNRTDPIFMREWLAAERDACRDEEIDECDIFAMNTAQVKRLIGLNSTELAILRFACLLNCYRPLDAAAHRLADAVGECLDVLAGLGADG